MDRHHPAPTPDALTPRQRDVAALIAEGLTNAEIGERLGVAPGAAAHDVEAVLDRLGVSSRAQVAAWAVAHGLVGVPPRTPDEGVDAGGGTQAAP